MRTLLLFGLALALADPSTVQDKNSRKQLETTLREAYKLTKTQFFQDNNISGAGTLFVVQKEGLGVDMTSDAVLHTSKVVGGNVQTGGGGGGLFSKSTTKHLNVGDRVYATDIDVSDDRITFKILTRETYGIQKKGTTKESRYAGFVMFMFDKNTLATMDVVAAQKAIEAVLVPEDKAVAVNTKTIELGQTIDEVEKIFGKPESIAKLGPRTIFTYKTMKVVFTDGKVTDVQ
jgi:hypothetical protein